MRLLVLAVLLAAVPSAAAAGIHGPQLASVSHEPVAPMRGQAVHVVAWPEANASITGIHLIHCRLEPTYACSVRTDAMRLQADGSWVGEIPWQPQFFRGATWVGYNLTVRTQDGGSTTAPTQSTPLPENTPEGVGTYYFYRLPQEATTPGPSPALILLALIAGGAVIARRHAT
jgi:hypothetical protein